MNEKEIEDFINLSYSERRKLPDKYAEFYKISSKNEIDRIFDNKIKSAIWRFAEVIRIYEKLDPIYTPEFAQAHREVMDYYWLRYNELLLELGLSLYLYSELRHFREHFQKMCQLGSAMLKKTLTYFFYRENIRDY